MLEVTPADRLAALPPYLFAEIDRRKEAKRAKGQEIIDLGVGDPDLPTPEPIVEALAQAAARAQHHRYATNAGLSELRQAVAAHYAERHAVSLDPDTEVICLLGTKEGIGHLPLAVVNPGEEVLVPDPGYPVYQSGTLFAGGVPRTMPLHRDLDYLPDLAAIESKGLESVRLMFVNYPNNPTGAPASLEFYEALVAFARRHRFLIAADAAYAEIVPAGAPPAPSLLAVAGAKDVAVEFGSFSKMCNMTGWRLGWAVGHAGALEALIKVKSNLDSGVFEPIQLAGRRALEIVTETLPALRRVYDERRQAAVAGLRGLGVDVFEPGGTFYVWARVPDAGRSVEFAARVLRQTGVVLTPGVGFGKHGEGYFRIALCSDTERIQRAMTLLAESSAWAPSAS